MSKNLHRGLSLIECCVTLTLTSVLTTAGVSSFKDLGERRRLEGHSAGLSTDLHYLRTEAVSRNRSLRIEFVQDAGGACYVLHTGAAGDCSCSSSGNNLCGGGAEPLKVVSLPSASRIGLASNVNSILVDGRLGTATPGGTIRLRDGSGREIRHIVNIMGRLRTCSPNGEVGGHPTC